MVNQPMGAHRQVLIFEHIPKTAGSTLRTILRRVYGDASVFIINPGNSQQHLSNLLDRFGSQPPVNVIVNHAGYGLQDRLPSSYRYRHFVMLREPVERVISYYYYRLQTGKIDASVSLEEYVQNHPQGIWNWQTAFLGKLALQRNLGEIELTPEVYTEELLDRAKGNLRKQMAVGLMECFDESLLLFKKTFGWRTLHTLYVRKNTRKRRPARGSVSDKTLRVLKKYNELDLELYAYGRRLFEQQLQQTLPNLKQDLNRFRKMNTAYGKVFPVVYPYAAHVVHGLRNRRPNP